MLPVGWLVAIVAVAVVLTTWVTFTLTRLDRLHARVDAAQAALDAQLVRRAAALQHAVELADGAPVIPPQRRSEFENLARAALEPDRDPTARRIVENAVSRAVVDLAPLQPVPEPAAWTELRESAARVLIARRFYNDAVRDTRALRSGRLPRLFRMAGRRAMPEFFDIDDTAPPRPLTSAAPAAPATVTTPDPTPPTPTSEAPAEPPAPASTISTTEEDRA